MRHVLVVLGLITSLTAGRAAFVPELWSFLYSAWSEAGLGMDPDGDPNPAPTTDAGLGMDPNGKPGS